MIKNSNVEVTFKELNNKIYPAFVAFNRCEHESEKVRTFRELRNYLSEANTLEGSLNGEPFIPWFMNALFKKDFPDDAKQKTLATLSQCGLKFDALYDFLGKKISLLTYFSQFDDLKPIKFLVEHMKFKMGADETIHPITVALMKQQTSTADYLIAHCALYSNYSPLGMAAHFGSLKLAQRFIEERPSEIDALDKCGMTPLMHAAHQGQLASITQLLKAGANLFACSEGGRTFFQILLECENSSFFDKFIAAYPQYSNCLYSTDRQYQDKEGCLPIHYAIANKKNALAWVKQLLSEHPLLAQYIDAKGRSLAYHAVISGELSLLIDLKETHGISLDMPDSKLYTLLDYCITYERIEMATWLDEQQAIELNPTNASPPIFHAISKQKKSMIDWFLSHPSLDLTRLDTRTHQNIAFVLVKTNQFEFIIKHDLYRRNPSLLFLKNENGLTSIDEFFNQTEFNDCEDYALATKEQRAFIRYVLNCLEEIKEKPSNRILLNFKALIEFSLNVSPALIRVDDFLGDSEPLFHQWEPHFYDAYQKMIQCIADGWLSPEHEEENAKKSLIYYQANILEFVGKYKPNLNSKDINGEHLITKLIRLGADGASRIKWLCHQFSEIMLTHLDLKDSSLLHLACEQQQLDIIRWCLCDKEGFSILEKRSDGLSALDIALQSNNTVICKYLIQKLSATQWKKYLASVKNTAVGIQLETHEFYGRPPKARQAQLLESPNAIHTSFSNLDFETKAEAEADITYGNLIETIRQQQVSRIKAFKQEQYQSALSSALDGHSVLELMKASDYQYAMVYQLIRIPAFKPLLDSHWKQMFQDVISNNNARVLFLFLNQALAKPQLETFGFDLLSQALDLKRYDMLMMLLSDENIALTAHQNNNQLLREVSLLGLTHIALKLLDLSQVRETADALENDALRRAAEAEDLETCEALLKIPQVLTALKINDYAFVREVQANDAHDLLLLMRRCPDIQAFLDCEYSEGTVEASSGVEVYVPVFVPFYFYNPDYYVPLINSYDFYDAILAGDGNRLETLFYCAGTLNPNFIFDLTSFALTQAQPFMVQRLFQLAMPVLASNLLFCNRLITQAVRTQQIPMIDLLCQLEPIRESMYLYDNRVFRTAIRSGLIAFAFGLLTDPNVQINLHLRDQGALRWSVDGGYTPMVAELLKYHHVSSGASVFNYAPLRKAFQKGHMDIVLLLLDIPHVLHYAKQQNGLYDEVIKQFLQLNPEQALIAQSMFNVEGSSASEHMASDDINVSSLS
jgi:ankyrin repeat protein